MLIKYAFLSFIQLITCEQRKFESFIVGGQDAPIEAHPHSAFMTSSCTKSVTTVYFRCGASIVNQRILLTAAHCFECRNAEDTIISVGSSYTKGQFMTSVHSYLTHPKYKDGVTSYDIAVMRVRRSLPLSQTVSRVALLRNPPYNEIATVAGWGLVNEFNNRATNYLKYITQKVLPKVECIKILTSMPNGCICAGTRNSQSYVSMGDSGSALVVRGFIQIGVVSYKDPIRSMSVTVYTDTAFFYNWIQSSANTLICQ